MNEFLLDTHILIWAICCPENLSKEAIKIIEDNENIIYVSVVSFWEISIKFAKGNLDLGQHRPENFPQYCRSLNFKILDLDANFSSTLYQLKAKHHSDPFDRIIIWHAINHNICLISDDSKVRKYAEEGLSIL